MKNVLAVVIISLLLISCFNRRAYYAKRTQEIQDSLNQVAAYQRADDDNDGVINYYDSCANTPRNARVYANGCAMDIDLDSVPDYKDRCVSMPGLVENQGCPRGK